MVEQKTGMSSDQLKELYAKKLKRGMVKVNVSQPP
jgi:hypothetical protein